MSLTFHSDALSSLLQDDTMIELSQTKIVCRASDGYVNLSELCKAGGRTFSDWKRNIKSSAFLETLSTFLQIPRDEILVYEMGSIENRSTWGHPQVAINIAQWISPEFSVRVSSWIYEIAATGKVELHNEKSSSELTQDWKLKIQNLESKVECLQDEKKQIRTELNETIKAKIALTRNHNAIVKKRQHHKFKEGACFYLWHNPLIPNHIKVGFSESINECLRSERRCVPNLYLNYLVFLEHAKLLESIILAKYQKDRIESNHEIIACDDVKELIQSATDFMESCHFDYAVEQELWKYNNEDPPIDEDEEDQNEDHTPVSSELMVNGKLLSVDDVTSCICPVPTCDKILSDFGKARRHFRSVHEKSTQKSCPECNKIFSSPDTLAHHIRVTHSKEAGVICPHCSKKISSTGNLKKHIESIHTKTASCKCPDCGKILSSKYNLSKHRQLHMRLESSPCPDCKKDLKSKLGLEYHQKHSCPARLK